MNQNSTSQQLQHAFQLWQKNSHNPTSSLDFLANLGKLKQSTTNFHYTQNLWQNIQQSTPNLLHQFTTTYPHTLQLLQQTLQQWQNLHQPQNPKKQLHATEFLKLRDKLELALWTLEDLIDVVCSEKSFQIQTLPHQLRHLDKNVLLQPSLLHTLWKIAKPRPLPPGKEERFWWLPNATQNQPCPLPFPLRTELLHHLLYLQLSPQDTSLFQKHLEHCQHCHQTFKILQEEKDQQQRKILQIWQNIQQSSHLAAEKNIEKIPTMVPNFLLTSYDQQWKFELNLDTGQNNAYLQLIQAPTTPPYPPLSLTIEPLTLQFTPQNPGCYLPGEKFQQALQNNTTPILQLPNKQIPLFWEDFQ